MCIKPLEIDITISGGIESQGAWEFNLVNNVVRAMAKFADATFLGKTNISNSASEEITCYVMKAYANTNNF